MKDGKFILQFVAVLMALVGWGFYIFYTGIPADITTWTPTNRLIHEVGLGWAMALSVPLAALILMRVTWWVAGFHLR